MTKPKITTEEFDEILGDLVAEEAAQGDLMSVAGFYELVSEHFNNDVLARWAAGQEEETT